MIKTIPMAILVIIYKIFPLHVRFRWPEFSMGIIGVEYKKINVFIENIST